MSGVNLSPTFGLSADDSQLQPDAGLDDWYVRKILDAMPPGFPVVRRVLEELFPPQFRVQQEVQRILADLVRAKILSKTRDVARKTDFYERVTSEKKPYRI